MEEKLYLIVFNILKNVQGEKSTFLFHFCPLFLWWGFIPEGNNTLEKILSQNIEKYSLISLKKNRLHMMITFSLSMHFNSSWLPYLECLLQQLASSHQSSSSKSRTFSSSFPRSSSQVRLTVPMHSLTS